MSRSSVRALMIAAATGDDSAIRRLVRTGVSVSTQAGRNDEGVSRETALMLAAQTGKLSTIRILIEAGADPAATTSRGQTAIYYALSIRGGTRTRVAIARLLLKSGCPLLGNEIHCPVYERSLGKIRFLLEAGCRVNEKLDHSITHGPQHGDTPLALALGLNAADYQPGGQRLKHRIVRELIRAGANPNLPGSRGRVPLMFTDPAKEVELRTILLQAGADPALERRRKPISVLTDADREKNRNDFEALWNG